MTTLAFDVNEIWCKDVAFVDKIAMPNDGVKFLLVCVDVLSRYLRVEPLKRLTSVAVKDGLAAMLKNARQYIPTKFEPIRFESLSENFASFAKL